MSQEIRVPGPGQAGHPERFLVDRRGHDTVDRAGLETQHVEGFREDYAETLRHWARRLDEHLEEGERLVGPERLRVWRLYLRAARNNFTSGFTSVYQVRSSRP